MSLSVQDTVGGYDRVTMPYRSVDASCPIAGSTQQKMSEMNVPQMIQIPAGEELFVKPGAMLAYSNLQIDTRIRKQCCCNFFCGTNVLVNTFRGSVNGGWITLEQNQPGQIVSHTIQKGKGLLLKLQSFMASTSNVELSLKWAGLTGYWKGQGIVNMRAYVEEDNEKGDVHFKTANGIVQKYNIRPGDKPICIDNNNLIAFTEGLECKIKKIGGIATTIFGGEGLVCEFTGEGVVYVGSNDLSLTVD